jgi:putative oxidoreductase
MICIRAYLRCIDAIIDSAFPSSKESLMNAFTSSAAVNSSSVADKADACTSAGPAALGAALLRLSLGVVWLAHALLKLFVFTLPGTAAFFESIGFAGWMAYPVFLAELAGGLALILGIYARQAALLLVPVMTVAAWVHLPNGWVHTSTGGGWEYPVFLILASISVWLIGDGAFFLRRSNRLTMA